MHTVLKNKFKKTFKSEIEVQNNDKFHLSQSGLSFSFIKSHCKNIITPDL